MRYFLAACLFFCLEGWGGSIAWADPRAPQVLVLVVCRVLDMTGQPGRHGVDPVTGEYDKTQAAHGWRDLELFINTSQEQECRTEGAELVDAVAMYWPDKVPVPLDPNFGNRGQCGRIGMHITAGWEEANADWAVVAIGCPSPIGIDADGDGQPDFHKDGPLKGQYIIKSWKQPGCPTFKPGTWNFETGEGERMKCRFDASHI